MQTGSVTTPFGRRSMTLAMLASQYEAQAIGSEQSVDKWKIFRALCEARPMLGLSDRALAVLNALLSFYPGNELSAGQGLVVFPSNAQLAIRAHGIAPATLRRHLAALVEAGLLLRKDSPNGKRFARRDGQGAVEQAYGFNIAPLIARAGEIQSLAIQVTTGRNLLRATRERLSLCRRDVAKLIDAALQEGVCGDWTILHGHFRDLLLRIPRSPDIGDLEPIVEAMERLRQKVLNLLEVRINARNMNASESRSERHIQITNPDSIFDLEPASNGKAGETTVLNRTQFSTAGKEAAEATGPGVTLQPSSGRAVQLVRRKSTEANGPGLKSFPLALVLQACPEIIAYGPGGNVASWRELMSAATVVRSMLEVSPSAYEEACCIMGPQNAATVMACVLERAGSITSAGGYLRDLTRRTERGEFAVGPMLMALANAKSQGSSAGRMG